MLFKWGKNVNCHTWQMTNAHVLCQSPSSVPFHYLSAQEPTGICQVHCNHMFLQQVQSWLLIRITCEELFLINIHVSYLQFSSVSQSCPTLCDPMNHSTPGLPVHHQVPEFTQTHILWAGDATQPSHPLSSPSPPAPNPSQHQGLFQWVNSSHEVAKVLELQLQHQSFQWTPRTDFP